MESKDFIVEKDGKQFVDIVKLLPDRTSDIREIVKEIVGDKVTIYSRIRAKSKGSGSKKVTINRFIKLDELFFEGLGLWQAEGAKSKGLYFGNTCLSILKKFIEFSENKIGIGRTEFKPHLVVPELLKGEELIKIRWSQILKIPLQNFTKVSMKLGTNLEYCHLQFTSIILVELMKLLYTKFKPIILQNRRFASGFMRGIIAGEGQIELKSWGTLSYVSISSADINEVNFYKECLNSLGIESCKYENGSRKFPIYGRHNFEKMKLFNLLYLHPEKLNEFENGLSKYKRNVMKVEEMKELVLQELLDQPKTYNQISNSLKKGRSTIQAFYIPMLEKEGLINRIGKRKQGWLFAISKFGIDFLKK